MWYVATFLLAIAVDCIPVLAPPVWTVLVYMLVQFDLNPWILLPLGVFGSCLGRLILMAYMPKLGQKTLSEKEYENLTFLGDQLSNSSKKSFIFVFVYTLTPLSTTALFTAAGLAKARKIFLVVPFALGKLISDGVMIYTGNYAVHNFSQFIESLTSVKGLLLSVLGLLLILFFMFVDWRALLEHKKLKFQSRILK